MSPGFQPDLDAAVVALPKRLIWPARSYERVRAHLYGAYEELTLLRSICPHALLAEPSSLQAEAGKAGLLTHHALLAGATLGG